LFIAFLGLVYRGLDKSNVTILYNLATSINKISLNPPASEPD